MSQFHSLMAEIISILEESGFCNDIQILETSFFSFEQFTFKIRAQVFLNYTLQIRIYFNKGHFDYSYQVFDPTPLCRWDNKEHFPKIKTHPHHFHTLDCNIVESPLKSDPATDLKLVLNQLKILLLS